MAFHPFLFLLSLLLLLHRHPAAAAVKGAYWFSDGGLPSSSIDSTLFTHLFCAFADLNPTTNQATISSSNAAAFSSFTSTVKQNNPTITTLLSIGGGGANRSSFFSSMAANPSSRKSFIDSSITLARANSFSGLDLDWEYPSSDADMANFGALITEWRAAVLAESQNNPLLLTAAVYVSSQLNELTYPVDKVANGLDWINVMAYDFYDPTWKRATSAPAALYDPSGGASGSGGVGDWKAAGLDGGKIVLGMPFYGYSWRLEDGTKHGIGAAATGVAAGAGVGADGSITYGGVKAFEAKSGVTGVYNATVVTNYCYGGTTWIGYDDVESVAAKVKYAKGNGLLGYFGWSVSADQNWVLSTQASTTWDTT